MTPRSTPSLPAGASRPGTPTRRAESTKVQPADGKTPVKTPTTAVKASAPRVPLFKLLVLGLPLLTQATSTGARRSGALPLEHNQDFCPSEPWAPRAIVTRLAPFIHTWFAAEVHDRDPHPQPSNLELNGQVLWGAIDTGNPVYLHRELWPTESRLLLLDNVIDNKLARPGGPSPSAIEEFLKRMNIGRELCPDDKSAQFLKAGARSKNTHLRQMSFYNPTRMDMTKFLENKALSIASVGAAHALMEPQTSPRGLRYPWVGELERMDDSYHRYGVVGNDQFMDMWNGFARALEKGRAALVFQGEIWHPAMSELGSREDMYRYFNQGMKLAVLEVPLGQHGNATIVGPADVCMPIFTEVAQVCGWRCALFCDTLPGCTPETAPKA